MSFFTYLASVLITLSLGIGVGWLWARRTPDRDQSFRDDRDAYRFRQDYFKGLNYLINEQPDKAVDTFIKLLDVDSDTVEMHLALGNLFRRRGEVDRAIRVHQNLIARPELNPLSRSQALCALGRDYLEAGVLDRAEGIFIELARVDTADNQSLDFLLHIYQQEKAWEKAVEVASRLQILMRKSLHVMIAQFYCELAAKHEANQALDDAFQCLKRALALNRHCVRAILMRGQLALQRGDYRHAIQEYRNLEAIDANYLSEIVAPLFRSYQALGQLTEYAEYLKTCLKKHSNVSLVIALADYINLKEGVQCAIDFVASEMQRAPSLKGLNYLLQLYCQLLSGDAKSRLELLKTTLDEILRSMAFYHCTHCGFSVSTLIWLCPSCHHWETIKPQHQLSSR